MSLFDMLAAKAAGGSGEVERNVVIINAGTLNTNVGEETVEVYLDFYPQEDIWESFKSKVIYLKAISQNRREMYMFQLVSVEDNTNYSDKYLGCITGEIFFLDRFYEVTLYGNFRGVGSTAYFSGTFQR